MALLSLGETPPTILFLSTLPILLISAIVYRAFFSHLSSVPGPWPCRFTSLWIWYHSYLGHEASLINALHAQYGPIVRIGPSSVVIFDGAALNAIYNERGGFRKADCYANFDFEGHATIFSSRDGEYRALRSKAVTPLFSTIRIRAGQKTIEECVRRFIERVRLEAQEGKPVDILNPCRSLAIDAVSSYLFGRPYGGIEEKSDRLSASVWVDMVVDSGRFFFLPHWLFVAIDKISSKVMPCVANAAAEAGGANLESFAEAIVKETPAGDETYQGRLKAIGVSDDENQIQCMDLMFAGKYKSRMNMPFMVPAEAIRRHRLHWNYIDYKCLRHEILQADAQDPSLTYNPQNLKYLDAVIREGLRMGMSTPTRLPRIVPKDGWTYAGHYLPEGTMVGCQLYTLHFNPSVFPEPFVFKPERWLDGPSSEMQRDWIPFSLGLRACLARNLAQLELLLAVREIMRQDLLSGARALGGELEMYEWFSSRLVGERLELVW